MAGLTKFQRASKMLEKHNGKTMHVNELRLIVIRELASDDKSVNQYLRLMNSLGLIHEESHLQFKVTLPND